MIDPSVINSFDTISLEDMGKVRLMNRVDTKYVTDTETVMKLLKAIAPHYRVQQIDGRSIMPYYTRYYDTPDTMMFYEHQRGKKTRQKVRVRQYEECDTPPFVEIKSKNNKGRSSKKRTAIENREDIMPYFDFLSRHTQYAPESLVPQLENHFYRITLVDKNLTERVTIDTDLEFHSLTTDARVGMGNVGIIERKRDGRCGATLFDRVLNELRVRPAGFSKYCIGMAVTNPGLRQNRLKRKLRMINRIDTFHLDATNHL